MKQNGLSNFGMGSPKEPSCEIVLKAVHWLSRRSGFKLFSTFSPGGHVDL